MIRNFIHVKDSFLKKDECNIIIDFYKNFTKKEVGKNGNYKAVILSEDVLKNTNIFDFLKDRFQLELNEYIKTYSELNFVEPFGLDEIRIKHWKPNKFFNKFHSEHSTENNLRILNFMIYLTEHKCGTQFLDERIIKSKTGRLVIMPSYFTHTHRGMPCPEKKDRYMLSGYFKFKRK